MYHMRELRRRLFASVVVGIVVGSFVYYYRDFFIKIVMEPLGDQKLIYLTPAGGFSFIFMVTFYITLLIVLPFLLYQLYAFLKPAIPRHTRRLSVGVSIGAAVLMVTGATFGYIYAVPAGLSFLSNFASEYVMPSLTADSYLTFVLGYVLGIGMLFELPLLLLFWHWIHPLTPKGLLNSERFVILGAFIAAAMLSPSPDALSQAIIAVPIIIVYQLGVLIVLVSIKKARKLEKRSLVAATRVSSPYTAVANVPTTSLSRQVAPVRGTFSPKLATMPQKNTSIDGMLKSKPVAPHLQKRRSTPRIMPPTRPQSVLRVTQRPRTINDIRPIRNSIIDIGG
jgi:sec-independent protein translocase protein TatC